MPVPIGSRLGPYEILAAIGAGGMGEVFRARDTKLGRDVAIKVLPEAFARDADRMARFQREARLLAALNHSSIASIYGLEDSGKTSALVMELAEGPTLADRIAQGPLPIDDALRIAKQICDALEYAHEKGIVHRDLKPANVKVAADDTVKILDFGLAKAMDTETTSDEIANSPTLSRMATQTGVLLGTASYMSPEQAKAKPVDRRADIWAFGCVLYEMLTAKKAFDGETVPETLGAIMRAEPVWKQLPSGTPMRVRVLLQRCLQKDSKQRLQAIGDARISLDEVLSGAQEAAAPLATPPLPAWRRALPWAVAAALALALAIVAWAPWRAATKPVPAEPMRFQIPVPKNLTLPTTGLFSLSPNGRQLAFLAVGSGGVGRIWVRSLDSLEARSLPGTEISPNSGLFFWSPDSRFIAFDTNGKLKKIPVSGGPAETICDASNVVGAWNRDGVIVFSMPPSPLMRVSAAGGSASPLTRLSRGETTHAFPWFLPDGKHFLYWRTSPGPGNSGIFVGSLDAKPEEQSSKLLAASDSGPAYVPSSDPSHGYLLFVRGGALLAQPFDAGRMELTGEAVTVADSVGTLGPVSYFSASDNGALAYQTGSFGSDQLTWYNRQGRVLGTVGEAGGLVASVRISPDGRQAAISRTDAEGHNPAVWLLDFARGTSTRFTFRGTRNLFPVWSPNGSGIVFSSDRAGSFDLYEKPANGATGAQLLLKSPDVKYSDDWSHDGKFFLSTEAGADGKASLWVLPLQGDKKPFPFLQNGFNEQRGRFSPGGRWIAYVSDESGRNEVYVRPFSPDSSGAASGAGGKWLVSTNGGMDPRWRGDGKELYYIAPDGKLMAVDVATEPEFQAGVPKALFQTPLGSNSAAQWDVSADGKHFLFPVPKQAAQTAFTVVLNWQAALKK